MRLCGFVMQYIYIFIRMINFLISPHILVFVALGSNQKGLLLLQVKNALNNLLLIKSRGAAEEEKSSWRREAAKKSRAGDEKEWLTKESG